MENTWRYPSVQLESPTVQMAPPYYDNGTNSGNVDFSSSHSINRAMGAANDVVYQQSSWIPMQTVADFQMSVARISHIMRDGPRLPGYSLQSNIHYANYNAVPATQPSYQQSRWSAQPLQGHYPMVAANSLHVTTEDSGFSVVPQSYYAHSSSMPTPQLSQAQSSNWTPQSVVTEFPIDAVSRPQIKVENSGFLEFSHQPDEINHAPYSEAPETLSSNEQSSNWAPQSEETNFPVGAASTSHIKVENSGLSEFSHGTNESHTPYTEVPEASLSNEQSSNWTAKSVETYFPVGTASVGTASVGTASVGTASGTHIKVEISGLSEFSYGPNESHAPYTEVPEAPSSNEQTSWMPPQAGFPTDTGSSADIKTEDPGHSECSYQSGERTVESTVPTIQPSNEKDDFEVQESTVKFNQDVKETIPDHCRDGTSAASSSLAMEEREQEASTEQDGINKDHSQNPDYPDGLVSNDFALTGADCTWLPDDNYSSRSQDENLPDYFVASHQASNEEIQNNGRQLQNWFCPTCYETFSSSDCLSTHQEQVHSSGMRWYKCQHCSETFTTPQNLKTHVVNEHTVAGERPFACAMCSKTFKRTGNLKDHVNIHTKEKELSCKVCKQAFFSRAARSRHTKSHNQEKQDTTVDFKFECEHCQFRFPTKSKLTEHMRSHRPRRQLRCKVCGMEFETKDDLKSHSSSVHSSDASLSCSTCDRNFSCKQSLKIHIQSIHDNKDRPFKCTLCDKAFNRKDIMEEHVNLHTKEKVYSCIICQHSCYSRGAYWAHMLSHTLDDESAVNDENVTCEHCLKQFSDKSALKEHMCSHSEKRELSCEVCFLTFETLASLRLHHAVHADSKPGESSEKSSPEHKQSEKLSFGTCSKVYFSRQAFKRHTRLSHDVTTQRLPCTMCDKTFKCRASLKEHMNTHTENKGYPCNMCESACSTRFGLHRHKETHSIDELEAAAEREILQRYKQSHIQGKPINIFTCLICKDKFPSFRCIEEHLQRHVLETLFDCSICPATFKSRYSLFKHKIAHFNGKPFECSNCGKAFRKKSHMKEHQLIHTRVRKFNCTQCPATFQDFADLRKHRETHPKPQEVKKHECKICHRKFLRPNILRMHAYKHTKAKPFSCSVCSKKFIGKYSCQQHELTHRMERNHKCPICGVAFHYPGRLKIHMKSSHSDSHDLKLFACDLCDKRYGHSGTLTAHRKTHFDQELYSCSLCNRSNLSKRGLRNHQRSHAANQRIYPCDKCDKKFKTRHHLAYHLASALHSNVRPYLCQVCGKTFTHLGRLRRHALAHSQNKRFICEVCGKTCSRRDNLRTHMKVHNPSRQKKVEGI